MSKYGPADVVVKPDGTTLVRVERFGVVVYVNIKQLQGPPVPPAPPVGGFRFDGREYEPPARVEYLSTFGITVNSPRPYFGGVVA